MHRRFELSGHRGARGLWPENTLTGFAGALRLGVDALEFDVGLTADGVPVVLHDLALDPDLARRPDGRWIDAPGPAVIGLTLAELQRFDVGRARPGSATALAHPRQTAADGEPVPTLAAVRHLLAAHPVRLDLELKTDPDQPGRSPDPQRLAERVLDALGSKPRVTLRSFDWRGLRHAAALRPGLRLCFLTRSADRAAMLAVRDEAGRTAGGAADWAADWAGDWAPGFAALTPAIVAEAQRLGLRVKPWTVNRPDDMARLIAAGVDGFCTDDPDVARAVMAQAGLPLPPPLAAA